MVNWYGDKNKRCGMPGSCSPDAYVVEAKPKATVKHK